MPWQAAITPEARSCRRQSIARDNSVLDGVEEQAMTTAPYQSPFRRIFEEAFNQGNLAIVDEVFAAGYVAHIARNGATNGPLGVKWWIAMLRNAFPDLHCIIEEEIRVGDRAAFH
jgi:hypothetical protein